MARLDTTQLVDLATNLGPRAHQVHQDPAFQKARSEAARDVATAASAAATTASLVGTAATSIAKAVGEGRAAWRRTGDGGAVQVTRRAA